MSSSLLMLRGNRRKRVVVVDPPDPGEFGPGPNAPDWMGKTTYPIEYFNEPIPVHYSGPNVAGFKGWQGFDGAWGLTPVPTRVTYPTVETPLGTKPVIQVTYPGSSHTIDANGEATEGWTADGPWSVRITGTWSGTLVFETSEDGDTWDSVTLRGTRGGSGPFSDDGSSTTINGVWAGDDNVVVTGGFFRVRANAWTSGTATLAIGVLGGAAPARFSAGSFNANQTRIYTRLLFYGDPAWTNGGNGGTKGFFFSQEQGNNHYTGILGGPDNEDQCGAFVGLQQTENRSITGTAFADNGTWVDVEYLFIANTPGEPDGIAQAWINGELAIDQSDVRFFDAESTPSFEGFFMDPTYGGGEAPSPGNIYFQIAAWYRESAS